MSDQLERLYRERYEHFVRVATAVVGDPDVAHDVVQDAFATAVRKRRSFRGEGPLEAWVWRIVVNVARRAARRGLAQPLSLVESPAPNGAGGEDAAVRTWLAALPQRQRLVVFLRYYADLEYPAIAEILGIRVGTVSATLSSAHASLRRAAEEVSS